MKTIQIPMNSNPFTVVINNSVYQYKAGDTAEVPDEVAEAIENALELVPKPTRYLSKFAQFVEGKITEVTKSDIDGVETVFAYSLFHSENLKSAVVPDSVTYIGFSAFYNCPILTSVEIGTGVTKIGNNAFAECTSLARVIMRPMTPPTIQAETFLNVPTTCVFEVPSKAMEAYKAAEHWSAIAGQIVAIEE